MSRMSQDFSRANEAAGLAWAADRALFAGQLARARHHYEQALSIFSYEGLRPQEAVVMVNLGVVDQQQGCLEDAARRWEAALDIHRQVGDRRMQGIVLGNLGALEVDLGRHEVGLGLLVEAVELLRLEGDKQREALALVAMGRAHHDSQRLQEAQVHLDLALSVSRAAWDEHGQGVTLAALGALHQERGRLHEAAAHYRGAEALLHRTPASRATACIGLGCTLVEDGRPGAAGHLVRGTELAREVGCPCSEAWGLVLLAAAARDQADEATDLLAQARVRAGDHPVLCQAIEAARWGVERGEPPELRDDLAAVRTVLRLVG